jgi:hypothetical protein
VSVRSDFNSYVFVFNFQVVIGREEVDAGELLAGVLVAWAVLAIVIR